MKAAVVFGPRNLVVREVPEPTPGDYEVLCELLYGATCTGTDSHIVACQFPWISKLPTILGHESVGRVVKLGPKVRHYRVGDLVTRVGTPAVGEFSVTWGGFSEFGIARDHWAMAADGLPDNQWRGHRVNQVLPVGVTPELAPMFTTWRETLSYLTRRGFKAGQSILVAGSGGNGLSFARHAANLGASCVAMLGSPRVADAARKLAGVTHYVDYQQADPLPELKAACPEGFDLVIDAVGRTDMADRILPTLKVGGLYAVYGIDDFKQSPVNIALAKGEIRVTYMGSYDESETHQAICDFVRQGKLSAELWYNAAQAYPLSEINQAFTDIAARKSVKALIKLRP
jgi:2-desacetyl-2-hydroxyethyl bacteriochlorophyllide A dehydrogenase